jgi:hypothetical protein
MRILTIIIAVFILFLTVGCASLGTYFENRAPDLADTILIRGGGGFGVSGYVRITKIGPTAYAGIGWQHIYGFMGRNPYISKEITAGIGILGLHCCEVTNDYSLGYYMPAPGPCNFFSDINIFLVSGGLLEFLEDGFKLDKLSNTFWIEVNAFCFIGVNVGINPFEITDFLLGWFGVDIACDDMTISPPAKKGISIRDAYLETPEEFLSRP